MRTTRIILPILHYTSGLLSGLAVSSLINSSNKDTQLESGGEDICKHNSQSSHSRSDQTDINSSSIETSQVLNPDTDISSSMMEDIDSPTNSSPDISQSQDRSEIAVCDVTPVSGAPQTITDEQLNRALSLNDSVGKGCKVPCKPGIRLQERIETADISIGTKDPTENPPQFEDEEICCNDPRETDSGTQFMYYEELEPQVESTYTAPSVKQVQVTNDPTSWMIEALKTIHQDIQIIKPVIATIPDVKKRIDEIQVVIGEFGSQIIEMSNSIKNLELTVTRNRIDISKLTDLIMTLKQQEKITPPVIISPLPQKQPETNVDLFVTSLSKSRNLTGEQEVIVRNLLNTKDKDIIITLLKDLGTTRSLMGAELDKLINLNTGSPNMMKDVYTLLCQILPTPGPSGESGFIPSSTPLPKIVGKKVRNPYNISQ